MGTSAFENLWESLPEKPKQETDAFGDLWESLPAKRGLAGRAIGAASTALGPLLQTIAEGMAYAGPTGAPAPTRGPTPRQRMQEVTRAYETTVAPERERLAQDYPLTSLGLGLGGAVGRYTLASAVPGGAYALGAAEAAASKPEESIASLLSRGAGMVGAEGAAGALQRTAESPIGRALTDIGFGGVVDLGVQGYRGFTGARRAKKQSIKDQQELTETLAAVRATRGEPMATPITRQLPGPSDDFVQMGETVQRSARDAQQELTGGLAAVRGARGEPMATSIVRELPAPSGYVMPEPLPKALPPGAFPPESPRFRTRTVAEQRAALAEQQLRDAKNLDEAIAARQAAWEAEQAARIKALEEEPSRFWSPNATNYRPPPPPLQRRTLDEALAERSAQLAKMGQKRQADELTARVKFLDEMRKPWDELTDAQKRQFETFMTYYESRKAQGLVPAAEGATRKQFVKAQNRALRQLAAMEGWFSLPEAQRGQFLEAMQQGSLARRMEGMENEWQKAVADFRMTPLDQIVIINPATGREVTIASALKRPKSHPARFEAEAFMDELYTATRELTEGAVSGRGRTPFAPSRIGERPTARAAAELPPVPPSEAERKAARAAGEPERRKVERSLYQQLGGKAYDIGGLAGEVGRIGLREARNRIGAADPALITAVARTFGGAAVGGVAGASMGETPEERLAMGLGGALAGAGVAGGLPALRGGAEAAGAKLNEALEDITALAAKKRMRSPTGRPFEATPEGLTEVGVGGVKRGMPVPEAVTASRVGAPLTAAADAVVQEDRNLLQRMGLPSDLQDRLAPRIADIRAGMGEVQSWQTVSREAAKLLNTQRENLANIAPKNMSGAQGLAIASLVRENTETIGRNLASMKALDPTDIKGKDALLQQIDDLDQQNVALLTTIMAGRKAQAQALNANKILANLTSDPTYWLLKAQRVKGAESLTQDQRVTIANLLNKGEAGKKELLQYLATLRKSGFGEQVAQLRRAGLLTNPTGRIRDVISTGSNVVLQPLLRVPGALTDAIASRYAAKQLGGKGTQYASMAMPAMSEIRAMGRGALAGGKQALDLLGYEYIKEGRFKDMAEFVRAAELDPELLRRLDVPNQINIDLFGTSATGQKVNTIADFYQKYSMRVAGASDRVFREMAKRGALDEAARLQAKREGLTGVKAAERVQQLLLRPTDEMVADAVAQAEFLTFTNDGSISRFLSGLTGMAGTEAEKGLRGIGRKVLATMNIVFPFRRTPANIMTRVAEWTPGLGTAMAYQRSKNWLGSLAEAALEQKQTGTMGAEALRKVRQEQRRMIQNLTSQAGGLGLIGLGAYLYDQGVLTGDLPDDTAGREQWRLENKKPNSILIGGEWFPIGQIAPMGNVLAIAASMKQDAEREALDPSTWDYVTGLPFAAASGMLNQPMVTGPKEMLEAVMGGADERQRYARSLAGSFVPSGVAQLARATSPTAREPQSALEAVLSRIPGMQGAAAERLNIFGEPIQTGTRMGLTSTDLRRADKTVAEMARAGAEVAPIQKWRDEPFEQYQMRQRKSGQYTRQALNQLFMSPYYLAAKDEEKRDLIADMVKQARDYATEELAAQGIRRPEKRR